MLYEPPPQQQPEFNWIWAKWIYGLWEKFVKPYPLLAGETGVVNYEYKYNDPRRFVPSNLLAAIRAGTNTTDLSTYITNAITSADARGGDTLELDVGIWDMDEVLVKTNVGLKGAMSGLTKFRYSGDGSADSYVLKFETQSFATFEGITILAKHSDGSTYADNCVRIAGTMDLLASWYGLQFAQSTYDAIYAESASIMVNFSLDKVRWDSVGGYGINLFTQVALDSRPVRITNFTLDNNPDAGRGSPSNWGLGLIRIQQQSHVTTPIRLELDSARLEINTPLVTTTYGSFTTGEQVSLVYLEQASGSEYPVDISNIHVNTFATDQALVHSDSGTVHGTYRNISIPGDTYVLKDHSGAARDASFKGATTHHVVYPPSGTGQSGCSVSMTTTPSITASTWTDVVYNSIQNNFRSEYSASTGEFTVSSAGMYVIHAQNRVSMTLADKELQLKVQLDTGGGYVDQSISIMTTAKASQVSFIPLDHSLFLEYGWKVKIQIFHNDTGGQSISGGSTYNQLFIRRDS